MTWCQYIGKELQLHFYRSWTKFPKDINLNNDIKLSNTTQEQWNTRTYTEEYERINFWQCSNEVGIRMSIDFRILLRNLYSHEHNAR